MGTVYEAKGMYEAYGAVPKIAMIKSGADYCLIKSQKLMWNTFSFQL
jgi:hypothetical protein